MTKLVNYYNTEDLILSGEVWADIPDYDGIYQSSNLGRVKTLKRSYLCRPRFQNTIRFTKEKILTPYQDKDGYLAVKLSSPSLSGAKRRTVHVQRLIALTFINNPENKPQVNHKDGNKHNNNKDNLEWCACKENVIHAHSNGLIPSRKGIKHKPGIIYPSKWVPVIRTSITDGTIVRYDTLFHAYKEGFLSII